MIKHHVKEEEQPGGMFAEARKSNMDLDALGEQMAARKGELQAQICEVRPRVRVAGRMAFSNASRTQAPARPTCA